MISETITMKESLEKVTNISLEISKKLGEIEQAIVLLRSKEQQLNLAIQKLLDDRIKELQEFNKYAKDEEDKDDNCEKD